MKVKNYVAYTPGGSFLNQTISKTKKECIEKLMRDAAHMPYKDWDAFKKRGYTIEETDIDQN